MRKTKPIEYILLSLLVIGAFLLRVIGQLDKVFIGGNTWFRGTDAWYHMRLADITNFPRWLQWDMLAQYPNGAANGYMPLLAWLSVNDTVAAFIPPVCGALTLIFVYLIGRHLFSGKVGLVAALLVAVIPGEFLNRSLLGFTDHHVLEALFMSASMYCLLRVREKWNLHWSLLLGISLGLYALTWTGVAVFFFIIGLWLWWECLKSLQAEQNFLPLVRTFCIVAGIAGLLAVLYASKITLVALLLLPTVPTCMWLLTSVAKDKEKILFGLTIAVPLALVLLGTFVNYKTLVMSVFWGGSTAYIQEAIPLTISAILATYGIAFFAALGGLWYYRKVDPLFLLWAILLIVMSLGQRRWGYYAVIPVSLLAAALTFKASTWMSKSVRPAVIGIIVIFLILPNIQGTMGLVTRPTEITADWNVTLTWLRQNTPNQELFDGLYLYPDQKAPYGILSWWDYGHWIIRVAHRAPLTSPTQTGGVPSEFFTSANETDANNWLKGLTVPYVIIDSTLLNGKWGAVLIRAQEKTFIPVEECFLYKLWTEQAETWTKIYQRGDIKVYERNPSLK